MIKLYEHILNVPKEFWPLSKFRATLGHKVNHSFIKDNVRFGNVFHPRFGIIPCLTATKDIFKDEQLWVNYGYGNHSMDVPHWYIETYEKEVELQTA